MKEVMRFGKLMKDMQSFRNPGVIEANNLRPIEGSYYPHGILAELTNALSGRALGFCAARDSSNVAWHYAGDATKLYELTESTMQWADQSKGGGYTTATGDVWEFAVWERNKKIIATNYTDAVQSMAIGGGGAGAFADMITGTNTPKAKHVAIIGQFVVLGFTNDATDGVRPSRVWWSKFGDETNFDPDAATQSDFEDLSDGGAVQKIIGGNQYGIIFQRHLVQIMRYVGGSTIFEFSPIAYAPGTAFPNSIIAHRGVVYYIAEGGWYAIENGSFRAIGAKQVDSIFGTPTGTALTNSWCISTNISQRRDAIQWALSSTGTTTPDTIVYYNYLDDMWTTISATVEMLATVDLDAYGLAPFAFSSAHKLGNFPSPYLSGTVTTGDLQPVDGRRWQLNGVRPILQGTAARPIDVSIAARDRLDGTITYSTAVPMNADGLCPVRIAGRYMRVRCSLTSSFTGCAVFSGIELNYELEGER